MDASSDSATTTATPAPTPADEAVAASPPSGRRGKKRKTKTEAAGGEDAAASDPAPTPSASLPDAALVPFPVPVHAKSSPSRRRTQLFHDDVISPTGSPVASPEKKRRGRPVGSGHSPTSAAALRRASGQPRKSGESRRAALASALSANPSAPNEFEHKTTGDTSANSTSDPSAITTDVFYADTPSSSIADFLASEASAANAQQRAHESPAMDALEPATEAAQSSVVVRMRRRKGGHVWTQKRALTKSKSALDPADESESIPQAAETAAAGASGDEAGDLTSAASAHIAGESKQEDDDAPHAQSDAQEALVEQELQSLGRSNEQQDDVASARGSSRAASAVAHEIGELPSLSSSERSSVDDNEELAPLAIESPTATAAASSSEPVPVRRVTRSSSRSDKEQLRESAKTMSSSAEKQKSTAATAQQPHARSSAAAAEDVVAALLQLQQRPPSSSRSSTEEAEAEAEAHTEHIVTRTRHVSSSIAVSDESSIAVTFVESTTSRVRDASTALANATAEQSVIELALARKRRANGGAHATAPAAAAPDAASAPDERAEHVEEREKTAPQSTAAQCGESLASQVIVQSTSTIRLRSAARTSATKPSLPATQTEDESKAAASSAHPFVQQFDALVAVSCAPQDSASMHKRPQNGPEQPDAPPSITPSTPATDAPFNAQPAAGSGSTLPDSSQQPAATARALPQPTTYSSSDDTTLLLPPPTTTGGVGELVDEPISEAILPSPPKRGRPAGRPRGRGRGGWGRGSSSALVSSSPTPGSRSPSVRASIRMHRTQYTGDSTQSSAGREHRFRRVPARYRENAFMYDAGDADLMLRESLRRSSDSDAEAGAEAESGAEADAAAATDELDGRRAGYHATPRARGKGGAEDYEQAITINSSPTISHADSPRPEVRDCSQPTSQATPAAQSAVTDADAQPVEVTFDAQVLLIYIEF